MDVLAAGPEVKRGDTVTGVSQVGLTVSRQHHSPPLPPNSRVCLRAPAPRAAVSLTLPFRKPPLSCAFFPAPSSRPLLPGSHALGWGRQGRWGDKGLS